MPEDATPTGAHRLGAGLVGQRVVVRHLVPGERGPSGGPAMTDVLGVMEAWGEGRTTLRTAAGDLVEVETRLIVSGKPVPPRPSRFARLSAEEVERRLAGLFRTVESRPLGDWVLRHSGTRRIRPDSALAVGDPGVPLERASAEVLAFYAERGRRPYAQVVAGSEVHLGLLGLGWVPSDPEEADTEVLLAGVASLSRALRGVATERVCRTSSPTAAWLAGDDPATEEDPALERALALDEVVFASIDQDGDRLARGRTNLVGDWALFADLHVAPQVRRQGLARAVVADAVDWAAERGAGVLALQVLADSAAAQRLYAGLGLERHHAYRHLTLDPGRAGQRL